LRFIDPGNPKSFQRFYRVRGVILHAPEDDEAVARGFDLVAIDLELVTEAEAGDLALDQPLGRLRQRPLRLADAHRQRAALGLASLHQKLPKEVGLSRTATSVNRLVPGGRQQRFEHASCRDSQGKQ
jgi:hypothetical protein